MLKLIYNITFYYAMYFSTLVYETHQQNNIDARTYPIKFEIKNV